MRRILITMLLLASAALVAAGCGQFGQMYKPEKKSSKAKVISNKPFDTAARKAGGCGTIETIKVTGRGDHSTSLDEKIKYSENPPTSGRHYQTPLDWGVYDTEERAEKFVHNHEHGHVVITYKGLSGAEKQQLLGYVARDPFHLVVLPRSKNPKNGVYFTTWEARLYCRKPSAPALQEFVKQYRDQGPELFMNDPKKQD